MLQFLEESLDLVRPPKNRKPPEYGRHALPGGFRQVTKAFIWVSQTSGLLPGSFLDWNPTGERPENAHNSFPLGVFLQSDLHTSQHTWLPLPEPRSGTEVMPRPDVLDFDGFVLRRAANRPEPSRRVGQGRGGVGREVQKAAEGVWALERKREMMSKI